MTRLAKNLIVLVVPTEEGYDIDQRSSIAEVLACEGTVKYDLGRYFQAQNDEELGLHWSFLIDETTNEELTDLYNSDLDRVERPNIWSNIDTMFEDEEEGMIFVDAWVGNDEEGKVIAKVNSTTGEVTYLDERAKTDRYAQNMITELVDEIKKNFVHPLN